ncbi:MAG: signal recognition particle protein, partial [Alphaproteobacteria bacterium]|nr:signal recognition particle protein [Alphaproteobacteria bacterium]
MFDSLQSRLGGVFDKLRGRGALTEADVDAALGEVRTALIEADVALPVVKDFIEKVRPRAIGEDVIRSVTPGQQVVKIVHDVLVETLGTENSTLSLGSPPAPILMVGLNGAGKTTTSAKIGMMLQNREKKRVLMASLDVTRPAAMEQLKILGEQAGVATLPIVAGQGPVEIARRAMASAKVGGYDVLILDTAGRQHVDEQLMIEVAAIRDQVKPHETLLVADSLTGQDAVNIAKAFNERVHLSGIILSRADGDARGGAALSMRAVTGAPIKFLATGEKLDALEPFHPGRVAGRILDMGDVVSLVERAAETIDKEKAEKLAKKMKKGEFDMNDLAEQLRQMKKMGGMQGVLGMLPGVAKVKDQLATAGMDDKILTRQEAIISSMTKEERAKPDVINGSRRKRIAAGSGVDVSEVNKLL